MLHITSVVNEINACTRNLLKEYPGKNPPCLYVIQVGNDPASDVYVRNKTKVCTDLGINVRTLNMAFETTQKALNSVIRSLSNDETVDAILLQLPLPSHLDEQEAINYISPTKDVDCLTTYNQGGLVGLDASKEYERVAPCTPSGIAAVLAVMGAIQDKPHVVVINRSKLVGLPLAHILLAKGIDATVTVCHSKTRNLAEICKTADVIVVAVGKPNFLTADMVNYNTIVFDVGINRVNGTICGDVDVASVSNKTSLITPVPGGVGKLTTAMLANNTAALWAMKHDRKERFS